MTVALVGATGQVGTPLVDELARRGHGVTALTIHQEDVQEGPLVSAVHCDANDPDPLIPLLRGHDVVITSIQYSETVHEQLIASVKESGVPWYCVNGGSGTLLLPRDVDAHHART